MSMQGAGKLDSAAIDRALRYVGIVDHVDGNKKVAELRRDYLQKLEALKAKWLEGRSPARSNEGGRYLHPESPRNRRQQKRRSGSRIEPPYLRTIIGASRETKSTPTEKTTRFNSLYFLRSTEIIKSFVISEERKVLYNISLSSSGQMYGFCHMVQAVLLAR